MDYYFKCYRRNLAGVTAGKLVSRELVQAEDDHTASHAAQPLVDQLEVGEFAVLEDPEGNIVAYWGIHD